jgi:hypothetical protein
MGGTLGWWIVIGLFLAVGVALTLYLRSEIRSLERRVHEKQALMMRYERLRKEYSKEAKKEAWHRFTEYLKRSRISYRFTKKGEKSLLKMDVPLRIGDSVLDRLFAPGIVPVKIELRKIAPDTLHIEAEVLR